MRIRRTGATFTAVAAMLAAAVAVATITGRAAAGAAPAKACTPTWKQVPTPHDLSTVGSVSVPGMLGSAGSVSVAGHGNVWFPFGYFDPNYPPAWAYPAAWIGRWDGHSMTTPPQIPLFAGSDLFGLGSSFDSATDGWFLVNTTRGSTDGIYNYAEHWQGGRWTLMPLAVNPQHQATHLEPLMDGVAALSPANAWAVGRAGHIGSGNLFPEGAMIEHWDGSQWSIVSNPLQDSSGAELTAITAISARDIWAVGSQPGANGRYTPLTEHWDGVSWKAIPNPAMPATSPRAEFYAVSASGGQVWAAGFQGQPASWGTPLIERFDGTAWTLVKGAPGIVPNGGETIYAAAPGNVWTTTWTSSEVQEFLHWDGRNWSVVSTPGPQEAGLLYTYTAFGGTGRNDVWAAGSLFDVGQQDATRNITEAIAHFSC